MDTASASIGIILMILFVGPVAYIIWQQSAKDRKRLQQLKMMEIQYNLNFDQVELSPSLLLGLDSAAKKLVVITTSGDLEQQVIDLNSIHRSCVKKVAAACSTGKEKAAVKYVLLELLNGQAGNGKQIVFYDEDRETGYDVETQLSLANKWNILIKSHLKS